MLDSGVRKLRPVSDTGAIQARHEAWSFPASVVDIGEARRVWKRDALSRLEDCNFWLPEAAPNQGQRL